MATREQLLAEAKKRGLIPKEKQALVDEAEKRGLFSEEKPQEDPIASALRPTINFAKGLRLGLNQAKSGAAQLQETIVSGVRSPFLSEDSPERTESAQLQESLSSEISARDKEIDELGISGAAGALTGEGLPSTLLPGGPTGGLARRVAGGIAADTAASVADPVRDDETRLVNLQTAATFSGALRGTGGVLSSGFRRLSNAKSGNIKNADIAKLIDQADKEDISLFFDDATQGTLAQKASVAAEYFGRIGTGSGRARQNDEAAAAASRWLNRVSGDNDDFAEIVQSGVQRKLDIFKREASRKYARVAREIGDAGQVPTNRFNSVAENSIASETSKGTRANTAVVDFLNRFKDAPRGNFDEMIEFRSDFNKELGDFLNGDVSISKSSIDALNKAKNALDADMSAFASSRGANDSWQAANRFYQNTVVNFKKGKLRSLLNERNAANFDEQAAWRYLVQNSTNPKRARLMWQSLDVKGRNAVRFGLIKEAMEKAAPEGAPFSPAKFSGYLESKDAVVNQFFKGKSKEEINGLVNVMRHIERAGQFAENPPTGQRAIPVLLAGGFVIEPSTAIASTTFAGTVKGLFQTKTGRNLLLAANEATPGSKEFDKVMESIERFSSRASN